MEKLIKILESKLKDCKIIYEIDNSLTIIRNNSSINISVNVLKRLNGIVGLINHDLYGQFDTLEYYVNSLVDLIMRELDKLELNPHENKINSTLLLLV